MDVKEDVEEEIMTKKIAAMALALVALLWLSSCSAPGGGGGSGQDGSGTDGTEADPDLVADLGFEQGQDGGQYVIVGAAWTEGLVGDALEFDGYDHYVAVPDSEALSLREAGSVEAWIRADSHRGFAGVLHKGEKKDFSDEAWTLQFWGSDGTLSVIIVGDDGTLLRLDSTFTLNTGEWYHVAATWDTESLRLYINGSENNSRTNTVGPVRVTDGRLIIGAQLAELYNGTYGHVGFDGVIDEVAVYSRVLTPQEILAHFEAVQL